MKRMRKSGSMCPLPFHQVNILDRDIAAIAEIYDEDGEADGRFCSGDGQDKHGEDLPGDVTIEHREGDHVDVHRQKDQFDRHENDDDVLPVHEDANDTDREQGRRYGEVMGKSKVHDIRSPARSSGLSIRRRRNGAVLSGERCFDVSRQDGDEVSARWRRSWRRAGRCRRAGTAACIGCT
eukprot:GHVR01011037.1.p1 GENE.GHVR01011037.1~~GHVR01011037.1.p1  ORF type:complete len:180 (+),score=20.36 GHVR01011037.1:174-713(+)